MNPKEYANMYRNEDRHWWYRGMWRTSASLLDRHSPRAWGGWRVLDAGCGTGRVLDQLEPYGRCVGIDASALALGFTRCREHRELAQASVEALPFRDASFDLITSFDVLQHQSIADEARAMAELARVLRPGGWLLLRLPAYQWLQSTHDAFVHTRHRFTAGEVRELIAGARLRLRRLTYANTLLCPLIVGRRLIGRFMDDAHSDVETPAGPLNRALEAVLGLEAAWLRWRDLPFGLTVVALAQKPGHWTHHEEKAHRLSRRAAAAPAT